jgi:hypothetical protein
VLPGENVLLDPSASTFEDAQYAIVIQNMDPDEVKARYPKAAQLELKPDAVPGDETMNPAGSANDDRRAAEVDPPRLQALRPPRARSRRRAASSAGSSLRT